MVLFFLHNALQAGHSLREGDKPESDGAGDEEGDGDIVRRAEQDRDGEEVAVAQQLHHDRMGQV